METSQNQQQAVCGKESIDLLNCVAQSPYDQEKCLPFLQSLRKCVVDKIMIQSHNLSCKTLYETIGAKEDASQEEIRRIYRSAILTFHPDKLLESPESSNLGSEFLEVQRAWKVLGDPASRALYDHELRTLRQEDVGAEDVSVGDMMVVEDGEGSFELSYNCRCGDLYSISSCELDEMGYQFSRSRGEISLQSSSSLPASVVLPCGSCSLKIRIVIDANVNLNS